MEIFIYTKYFILSTKYIIDEIIPNNDNEQLIIYSFFIFLVPVITGTMIILDLYISSFVLKVGSNFRTELFDLIQRKPLSWFTDAKFNDLIQRVIDETEKVFLFLYQGIGSIIWFNSTIFIGIVIMMFFSPLITFLLILFLVLQVLIVNRISYNLKSKSETLLEDSSSLGEHLRQTLNGIEFIKSTFSENIQLENYRGKLNNHFISSEKLLLVKNFSNITRNFFFGLSYFCIYLIGGIKVINSEMSLGSLIALSQVYIWITPAVLDYQNAFLDAKSIIPSLNRIGELISRKKPSSYNGIKPDSIFPIKLSNISINNKDGTPILSGINLTIEKGKKYIVLGESGSGKSIITDVISNLIDPNSGDVFVNGIPKDEVDNYWFRKRIFKVSQDITLFNDSILNNLRYVNPRVSEKEINIALEKSCLNNWINSLPDGLNTTIGELSSKISGGEKQRIGIAQAVIRNPDILILDESTSGIDYENEEKILRNLIHYFKDKTIIFITHRNKLTSYFDEILYVNNNKIK